MTDNLLFTQSDFRIFLKDVPSLDFTESKSTYPYKVMNWTIEDSVAQGAGVMQFPSSLYQPTQWENNPVVSVTNYFHWQAWSEIIQLALEKNVTVPLLNDGLFTNGNRNPTVTLLDYVTDMLKPKVSSDIGSTPWSINEGNCNVSRLLCRRSYPGDTALQLPYQQTLFSNNWIWVLPVIPPRGYVSVGHFVIANQSNLVNTRWSPTKLLFLAKDARFVQPLVGTSPWPGLKNVPSYWNQLAGTTFSRALTQLNSSENGTVNVTYIYSSAGNLLFNKITPFPVDPTFDSYPSHFPWAVNLQLIRFFPNGPDGETSRFQTINVNRLISRGVNRADTGNNQTTPASKIVNPNYSSTFFYPVENGYKGTVNISFSPVNDSGQSTWPILIPMGIKDLLNCCTGQYTDSALVWDFKLYPPLPVGVTTSTSLPAQAICQAGGYSFRYGPLGSDCNLLTTSYCNPSGEQYQGSSNCDCYNVGKMMQLTGLTPYPAPPQDQGLSQTQQILSTNIGCLYDKCANVPSALKNTAQVPISGACPDITNCVISGNEFYGNNPAELINSCSGNSTGQGPIIGLNTTAQIFLIVAAVLFLVIGAVILLLRRRKKRSSDLEADHAKSEYDLYDDDEDAPSEYSKAFYG